MSGSEEQQRADVVDRRVVSLHSTQAIHDSADAYFAPIAKKLDSTLRNYSLEELATVRTIVTHLRTALMGRWLRPSNRKSSTPIQAAPLLP